MKRGRGDGGEERAPKKHAHTHNSFLQDGAASNFQEQFENMRHLLMQCQTQMEELRRHTQQKERETSRRHAEEREREYQMHYENTQREIHSLRHQVGTLKRVLRANKQIIQRLPHVTTSVGGTAHRQLLSHMNSIIANYNMLQNELGEML